MWVEGDVKNPVSQFVICNLFPAGATFLTCIILTIFKKQRESLIFVNSATLCAVISGILQKKT